MSTCGRADCGTSQTSPAVALDSDGSPELVDLDRIPEHPQGQFQLEAVVFEHLVVLMLRSDAPLPGGRLPFAAPESQRQWIGHRRIALLDLAGLICRQCHRGTTSVC